VSGEAAEQSSQSRTHTMGPANHIIAGKPFYKGSKHTPKKIIFSLKKK
jgi:hypothetical protein